MSNYSSTAAERPRQLPEQLGTAQRGGRGASDPSWKVVLGLNHATLTFPGCGTLARPLGTAPPLPTCVPWPSVPRSLSSAWCWSLPRSAKEGDGQLSLHPERGVLQPAGVVGPQWVLQEEFSFPGVLWFHVWDQQCLNSIMSGTACHPYP